MHFCAALRALAVVLLAHVLVASPVASAQQPPADDPVATAQAELDAAELADGPDSPAVAEKLDTLAELYADRGGFAKAEPLLMRALAIREKALGPDHKDVGETCDNLGLVYYYLGAYAKAEPFYQRSLAIAEKTAGPDAEAVASPLNNLGELYRVTGAYAKAEPLYLRALTIREAKLGPDSPDVATVVNNLAILYQQQGLYARAEPMYIRSLAIREKALGPEHELVAQSLDNLAALTFLTGAYSKAEPLYLRALGIHEKALGPDHPSVAICLNNLAGLYKAAGAYAKAEPLYVRSIAIREKTFGPVHPSLAAVLNNFAGLYVNQGEYSRAEPLYERALAIAEKTLGPDHPGVATTLNNMALLYYYQGDKARAEPLLVRARAIREKRFGPVHPDVAESLLNLGGLYRGRGAYAEAEPLYMRALEMNEKALGPDHPDLAITLGHIGGLYQDRGDYVAAEKYFARGLAIREKAFGPDNVSVAVSLQSLAENYMEQGQTAKAEPLLRRALAIREKVFGLDHPGIAETLNSLAMLKFETGDITAAVELKLRASDVRESELRRNLASGSEQRKRLYLRRTEYETDVALSVQAAAGTASARALRLGLLQVLRRKGRALDALVDQLATLARAGTDEDRLVLDRLAQARAEYANLALRGPGKDGPDAYLAALAAARERVDRIEADASARSARIRAELAPVDLESVTRAVPAGATLVEYAVYRPYDPARRAYGGARYVCFTLGSDGTIRWADLGDAAEIDALVAAFRASLRREPGKPLSDLRKEVKPRARALDARIFEPVRRLAGKSTRLLVAPDGQLSLVPFDALVDARGRYATETYEISYLTSGRDLVRLAVHGESRQPGSVVANPDFGGGAAAAGRTRDIVQTTAESDPSKPATDLLSHTFFRPLPGTAEEAAALHTLLPDATVLTGQGATKTALVALEGPRVLHIATHGFFLAGERPKAGSGRDIAPSILGGAPVVEGDDPLLRSGLAMAGANIERGGDAILTSLEAAGLDLWGTKLVVLSACDTGVGEVRNGDGVYGLRRALVLAGSETQVMSLWPVSDAGTRDLMIGYYRRLTAGEGRSAAMRSMRLAFLRDPKRAHPSMWSGFIVSGAWSPLVPEKQPTPTQSRSR